MLTEPAVADLAEQPYVAIRAVVVMGTCVGDVDELVGVTAAVLDWAAEPDLGFDASETPSGRRRGCRLLVGRTGSGQEGNADRPETELLFRPPD